MSLKNQVQHILFQYYKKMNIIKNHNLTNNKNFKEGFTQAPRQLFSELI